MRILFDQGTPVPLRQHLSGHDVETAFERGWSRLDNGDLLDQAEEDGYDMLVTTDQSLRHQQDLAGRRLAVVLLRSTSWPRIRSSLDRVTAVVNRIRPGDYEEVTV